MSDNLSVLVLHLREQLLAAAVAAPHLELYVLVDPTLGDTFRGLPTYDERTSLPIRYRELKAEHRPYLLRLGDFGRDEAIERSVSAAIAEVVGVSQGAPHARTVCGWLQSAMPNPVLASHLASHAVLSGSGGPRLLRFWDPRVMDMLATLLTPGQRVRLLRRVERMCWLGRDARLRDLVGSDGGTGGSEGASRDWLDTTQLKLLSEAAIVNRVLDVLKDTEHDLSTIDSCELARSIQRGSLRWDLRSERDRVMYGVYCVLGGDGFDQRAEVAEAMQQATRKGASVMTALEQFDGYDWRGNRSQSRPHAPAKTI
ncbi:DUF4123 domain-containing protein [Novilysobacter erysipheiresistens]|uniref:DUF4123 domain-containing protein n=1 Tax=Novilysobacter erysipheiresistens TaxID=1749332 RepID=A0ABU7YYD9_9GAMM